MAEATNKDELRERLRNLPRTSRTDTRYPIDAYEDDLVQIIIQYGLEQRLVEIDLLEQAINQGRSMNVHKLQRLSDLTTRLSIAKETL